MGGRRLWSLAAWAVAAAAAGQTPPLPAQRLAAGSPPEFDLASGTVEVRGLPTGELCAMWFDPAVSPPPTWFRCSPDRGATWGPAYPSPAPAPDWWLGPGGRIDLLWRSAPGEASHQRSLDGGRSFGPSHRLSLVTWAGLARSPAGSIAVTGQEVGSGLVSMIVSHDDGASWSAPVQLGPAFTMRDARPFWLDDTTLLAIGLSNFSHLDFVRSTDAGRTFTPPAVLVASDALTRKTDLAMLPGGEALLLYVDPAGAWTVRSNGRGSAWSSPVGIDPEVASTVALAADPDGAAMALLLVPGELRFHRSPDGSVWSPVAAPVQLASGCAPISTALSALGPGLFLAGGLPGFRTADHGLTWQEAVAPVRYQVPYDRARLLRRADGRLVAMWLGGEGGPRHLWSRVSDDRGDTWSAPVRVSDRADGVLYWPGGRRWEDEDAWAAIATRDGGFVVAWLAIAADGCGEYRVARSDDGRSWEPSRIIGDAGGNSEGEPLSLAELPSGELSLLLWGLGGPGSSYGISTSADGGRSWDAPLPVDLPNGFHPIGPQLATADGALLLPCLYHIWDDYALYLLRSTDRFQTYDWIWLDAGPPPSAVQALRAGSVLYLNNWEPVFPGTGSQPYLSLDEGRSWLRSTERYPWGIVAGDLDGSLYYGERGTDGLRLMRRPLAGMATDLGRLPDAGDGSALPFSAVALDVSDLGLVYAESVQVEPPGVFFLRAPGGAASGLLRDDRVRALVPRPDLGAIYPLAPYPTAELRPGMNDPDAGVLADAGRPLVFYGLGFPAGGPLLLAGSATGELRLYW